MLRLLCICYVFQHLHDAGLLRLKRTMLSLSGGVCPPDHLYLSLSSHNQLTAIKFNDHLSKL